jgi:hypothetical protein
MEPGSTTIRLTCRVRYESRDLAFPLDVPGETTIKSLKKMIRDQIADRAFPGRMHLYPVCV